MHPNFHKEYQWHIPLSRTIGKLLLFLHLLFSRKEPLFGESPSSRADHNFLCAKISCSIVIDFKFMFQ